MNLRMLGSDFRYRSVKSRDDGRLVVEDLDLGAWIDGESDLVYTRTVVAMDEVRDGGDVPGGVVERKRATIARAGKHRDLLSVRLDDAKGYELSLSDVDKMISTMFEDAAKESGDPIE